MWNGYEGGTDMKDNIVGIGVVGAGAIGIRSALMHFELTDEIGRASCRERV